LWNCEGDPLSLPEGEASQGGKPSKPPVSTIHFQVPINSLLHGARVDETPSARGPIPIQYYLS